MELKNGNHPNKKKKKDERPGILGVVTTACLIMSKTISMLSMVVFQIFANL